MKRDYFFLNEVAEKLGCNVRDLINFGATGQLDIYMLLTACYPYLIFECGEQGTGFRTIDPDGTESAMYKLPLVGPQRITQHGLQEFEISPGTAKAVFDWNKAAGIEDEKIERWYFPEHIRCLDESQMVIMLSDYAELCNKLNINEGALAVGVAEEATDKVIIKPATFTSVKEVSTQKNGLDKHHIAQAFAGMPWNEEQWKVNLSDAPGWLAEACVSSGRKGKGGAATWNPVLIAVALQDNKKISVDELNKAFKRNATLQPWADEWHDTQNPFRSTSK